MLTLAIPVETATLETLDKELRIRWFNENCYHEGMFYKISTPPQPEPEADDTGEYRPSQKGKLEAKAVWFVKAKEINLVGDNADQQVKIRVFFINITL